MKSTLKFYQIQRGISLLDLLCGLTIAAVAASTSAAAIHSQVKALRGVRADIEKIVGYLQSGMIAAQQYEKNAEITIYQHNFSVEIPGQLPKSFSYSEETEASTAGAKITLYPSGVTSPTTITLTGSSNRCSAVVALYGRIRTFCTDLN